MSVSSLLSLTHLVGLALAVGAATVKVVLLLQCRADPSFVPAFVKISRLVTRQIVLGLVLLTLSGIAWLLRSYPLTALLIAKLVLVATVWVLGPIIDKVAEPRFMRLAPAPGQAVSAEFTRARKHYLALEITATSLFYVVILLWVLG